MVYAPAAIVHRAHALDVSTFVGQHFRYGRGAYQFRMRTGSVGGQLPRLSQPGFTWICCPIRSGMLAAMAVGISLLFVLSQIANAAGFFREALASPRLRGKA